MSSLCCNSSSEHRVKPSLATGIHRILHPQPTHPVTPQHPHRESRVCQAASVAFALPWLCWGIQNPVAWAKGRVAVCQLEVSKKRDVADIPLPLACEIPRFFLGFHGSKKIPATVHVGGSLLVQMIIVTSRVRAEGILHGEKSKVGEIFNSDRFCYKSLRKISFFNIIWIQTNK